MFINVAARHGSLGAAVFPLVYREKPPLCEGDKSLVLSGRVQEKDEELKFLVESGYELRPENLDQVEDYVRRLNINANPHKGVYDPAPTAPKPVRGVTLSVRATPSPSMLEQLRTIFQNHPGAYPVFFFVEQPTGRQRITTSFRIGFDELVAKELEMILGPDTVKVDV